MKVDIYKHCTTTGMVHVIPKGDALRTDMTGEWILSVENHDAYPEWESAIERDGYFTGGQHGGDLKWDLPDKSG